MHLVSTESKTRRHHPSWSNVFDRVFVRWTTHDPPGLSALDVRMAEICDRFARKGVCQEIDEEQRIPIAKLGGEAPIVAEELRDLTNLIAEVERGAGEVGARVEVKGAERKTAMDMDQEQGNEKEVEKKRKKERKDEKQRRKRREKYEKKANGGN